MPNNVVILAQCANAEFPQSVPSSQLWRTVAIASIRPGDLLRPLRLAANIHTIRSLIVPMMKQVSMLETQLSRAIFSLMKRS